MECKIKLLLLMLILWPCFFHGQEASPHTAFILQKHPVERLYISSYTPLFKTPEFSNNNYIGVLRTGTELAVEQQGRYALHNLFGGRYTPIVREVDAYLVVLPNEQRLWTSPQLMVIENNGRWQIVLRSWLNLDGIGLALVCLIAGICGVALAISRPKYSLVLLAITLPVLTIASALFFGIVYGQFYVGWQDGIDFFDTAYKIASWEKPVATGKSIGWPLLLAAFYSFGDTRNFFATGNSIAAVNTFVLNPLLIAAIFGFGYVVTKKKNVAFLTAMAYLLLPWFYVTYRWGFPATIWARLSTANFWGGSVWEPLLPQNDFDLVLYQAAQWIGFHPLSDLCALTLFVGSMLLLFTARSRPNQVKWWLIGGLGFGYTCSTRIIYCVTIPAVLFWLWHKDLAKRWPLWQYIFLCLGITIGYSPQIVENFILFGSPVITPYHQAYHNAQSLGWSLALVPRGLFYLSVLHYPLLAAGSLAILHAPYSRVQGFIAAAAFLWLIFLAGFTGNEAEEIRYVMPALALLFCYALWQFTDLAWRTVAEKNMKLALLLIVIAFHFFCLIPYDPEVFGSIWRSNWILKIFCLLIAAIAGFRYGQQRVAVYAGITSALYLAGLWFVPPLALLIGNIWAVYHWRKIVTEDLGYAQK